MYIIFDSVFHIIFIHIKIPRPPISTLFPYTTLFRSTYPLTRDAIDELENYVLEYGVRSREQWLSTKDWIFQRFQGFENAVQTDYEKEMEVKINCYRRQVARSEEHTSELQSRGHLVCRLLL